MKRLCPALALLLCFAVGCKPLRVPETAPQTTAAAPAAETVPEPTETAAETTAAETERETVTEPTEAETTAAPATEASVNAAVGCSLAAPRDLPVSGEAWAVVGSEPPVGEYRFTAEGASFCLRAAPKISDISGLMTEDGALGDAEDRDITPERMEYGFWARWFVEDMQYCLVSEDAEEGAFTAVYRALTPEN